jgi:3-oxoacid CoA-transferase subunit A
MSPLTRMSHCFDVAMAFGTDRSLAWLDVSKVVPSAVEAIVGLVDGSTVAVGGFGLCGIPSELIFAVLEEGICDLRVVSNNCGVDDWGLGILLTNRRISRMTSSYVGENREFARQFLAGELEVELVPQGTLAERLRAGGCGIPAFYTPAGVGTPVADGGLPWRYASNGSVLVCSPRKEVRSFGGRDYVLEEAIVTDFALVRASRGDPDGNLVFHAATRNFNPLCAMAGRMTIAEVETLVGVGELDPNEIHLPGIFVQRVVVVGPNAEKRTEKLTTRSIAGSIREHP